jgi:nickel/cobalt exporter
MFDSVLTTIAITGFGIAFFHAAIPTHWLPFVLTARAQRWSGVKTLAITALAGGGHVFFTAALGVLVAWFGIALNKQIGFWFPRLAGGALVAVGAFYLGRQFLGHGHTHLSHGHHHHDHHHHDGSAVEASATRQPRPTTDILAITSLLALLTFSPCEAFVPIYVSGIRYGWRGFALLTAILSVATVAGMVIFTSLAMAGMRQVKFRFLEKYESGLVGVLLGTVGLLIVFFEK